MLTIFAVVRNSDLTEGRGGNYPWLFFTTKDRADDAAKGNGVMGTDADVQEYRAWETFEEMPIKLQEQIKVQKIRLEKLREQARGKLTKEERLAVGLPE